MPNSMEKRLKWDDSQLAVERLIKCTENKYDDTEKELIAYVAGKIVIILFVVHTTKPRPKSRLVMS